MKTCPHDPQELKDAPIGMYHCPECGLMVIAGVEHPWICECSGAIDYAAICSNCTPGWEEKLEECNKRLDEQRNG